MYRVFEALDELVTIVEEARGLPMTASCVVPRGDVLELLDDVRDALPGEVDDAQDVLDHRDQMLGEASDKATTMVSEAQAEAEGTVGGARAEAEATVTGARAEADRLVHEASAHADGLVARAREEAARIMQSAQEQHDSLLARAHAEADRTIAAGRAELRDVGRRRQGGAGAAGHPDRGRPGRLHRIGADPGRSPRRRRPDAQRMRHLCRQHPGQPRRDPDVDVAHHRSRPDRAAQRRGRRPAGRSHLRPELTLNRRPAGGGPATAGPVPAARPGGTAAHRPRTGPSRARRSAGRRSTSTVAPTWPVRR